MEEDNREADTATVPVAVRADNAEEEPSEDVTTGQTLDTDKAAATDTSTADEPTPSDASASKSGQKVNEGLTIKPAPDKEPDKSDASVEQVKPALNAEQAESAEQSSSTAEVSETNAATKQADTSTEVQTTGGTHQSSAEEPSNDEPKSRDQPNTTAEEVPQSAEEAKQSTELEDVQSTDAAGMPTSEQPCRAAGVPHAADEVNSKSQSAASDDQIETAATSEQPHSYDGTESAGQPRPADEEPQTAGKDTDQKTAESVKPSDTAPSAEIQDTSEVSTSETQEPQPQQSAPAEVRQQQYRLTDMFDTKPLQCSELKINGEVDKFAFVFSGQVARWCNG